MSTGQKRRLLVGPWREREVMGRNRGKCMHKRQLQFLCSKNNVLCSQFQFASFMKCFEKGFQQQNGLLDLWDKLGN